MSSAGAAVVAEVNTIGDTTIMEVHTIGFMAVLVAKLARVRELVPVLPQIMRAMVLVGMDMIGHTEEVVTIHTNTSLAAVEQMEGGAIRTTFPIYLMVRPCP